MRDKGQGDEDNERDKAGKQEVATTASASQRDAVAVRSLLEKFRIQEPALSELSGNGLDPALVQAWMWYIAAEKNLVNPPGYLVERLRAGDEPPADLLAVARVVVQLDDEDLSILQAAAKQRRWTGRWELDDERLEQLLDEETLEAYYRQVVKKQK
jgi:hypothetical protein